MFSPVFFGSSLVRVRVLVSKPLNHGLFHGVFHDVFHGVYGVFNVVYWCFCWCFSMPSSCSGLDHANTEAIVCQFVVHKVS